VSRFLFRVTSLLTLPLAVAAGVLIGVGGFTFWYAKGYSYFFSNPVYCTNCHIMRDHYRGWRAGPHHREVCNDCHLPHDPAGKWLAKADEGFRHSAAFTFQNVQVLRIIPRDRRIVERNCLRCHQGLVSQALLPRGGEALPCARCHRDVAHGV
jgi:cytochrome c nitrite reductase small subunit